MVNYSVDTEHRPRVYFGLTAAALALSYFAGMLIEPLSGKVSAFLLYGAIGTLFNRYLWKFPIIRHAAGIPDISGDYEGYVEKISKISRELTQFHVTARITQTWNKIEINLESEPTVSQLTVCSFSLNNKEPPLLSYQYFVSPKMHGEDKNRYGPGTQELRVHIQANSVILKGGYYSAKMEGGSTYLVRKTPGPDKSIASLATES